MTAGEAVILIGHGAAASDTPRDEIAELKRLEADRRARGEARMSAREAELDRRVRGRPRTPRSDPYKFGVEQIAAALAPRLGGRRLLVAYNEFCAPSVEDAIESLVRDGVARIRLVSTMFTRGGAHAEREIPAIVADARRRHPGLSIDYAWPFDAGVVADFLAAQLERVPPPSL